MKRRSFVADRALEQQLQYKEKSELSELVGNFKLKEVRDHRVSLFGGSSFAFEVLILRKESQQQVDVENACGVRIFSCFIDISFGLDYILVHLLLRDIVLVLLHKLTLSFR
ncbi:hypothetical protein R1flu_011671 [Riccia fluitans]|uniref:Uncharacterized protein n=1 Tax=Riccia fluitans TaxID=41844 RepID=A0ABD1Z8F9_9MARC